MSEMSGGGHRVGRTVLVTGGSNGIGREIAARFAATGERVIITGRDAGRVKAAADELGVDGVVCDSAVPSQVAELAGDLAQVVDVLVNNAGGNTDFEDRIDVASVSSEQHQLHIDATAPQAGLTDDLESLAAGWRSNLDANLMTAVLTTQAVADLIPPGGSVISIGSIGAERGAGSYGAAKAALAAWNLSVSAELGPRGVTANVISAGYIEGTDFFRGQLADARREALIRATHDRRPGRTEDIAETAYFLASPGARHITAQVIHVNGGAFVTR
jgi:3-oxoacyl-[acyl-carrier protein] reductase